MQQPAVNLPPLARAGREGVVTELCGSLYTADGRHLDQGEAVGGDGADPRAGNRTTEVRLAAIFRAHGITGWRRQHPLPGRPDFAFPARRLAGEGKIGRRMRGKADATGSYLDSRQTTAITAHRSNPPTRNHAGAMRRIRPDDRVPRRWRSRLSRVSR